MTGLASRLTESSAIANVLDVIAAPQIDDMNEKMAIDRIQKSLIRDCETAVNPTSSTITMPGTPPAYSTAVSARSRAYKNFANKIVFAIEANWIYDDCEY